MMSRILVVAGVIAAVVIVGRAADNDDLLLSNLNFDANDEPVLNFKSTFKKAKSSIKDVHSNVKSFARDLLFQDGCDTRPDIPINGNLSCSSDSGCRAACFEGYRFPHGETELVITCRKKVWKIQGADYITVPHCEAICLPECKNNGICVAPNVCNCQENYSGPQCQFENKPCLNTPPMVMNAQRKCNSKTCTITCLKGFVFSDGSAVANLKCKHGNWVPTRKDWVKIPECEPVCSPACQNGGICLSLNVCQCPKDFRGPQCQYRADVCSGDKLGFNGGYSCNTIDEGSYGCELTCPESAPFNSAPAARYVCRYETGVFEPQPIPQCQPQHGASLVQIKNEKSFFQSVVNRTWSLHGSSSVQQSRKSVEIGMTGQYNVEGGSGGWVQTGGAVIGGAGMGYAEGQRLERKPEAGTCFTWNGAHYKTFDGQIYSFESNCAYTLVKDAQDGLFSISIQNDPSCRNNINTTSPSMCPRVIRIFIQGKEYTLAVNTAGLPEFRSLKKVLPIPSQLAHARVEATSGGRFIVVSLDAVGLSIKWDGAKMVQVEASEALWNRTAGLCGNMNGEREDDVTGGVMHPGTGWRIENIGERCEEYPKHHKPCNANLELQKEASEFCSNLLSDARYKSCNKLIDTAEFESTCRWDYCTCEHEDRRMCACETMGVYVRQCAHKGLVALAGWRDNNICPMECTNGKIYMSCGPRSQPSCGADRISSDFASSSDSSNDLGTNCEEGCFCPAGTVAYESRCITVDECPCRLRGKSFESGAVVPKDCNTCVCAKGKWTCTESKCSARCSAVGDPHYTTFDGKRYDFMGKCSYYLVKGNNYSIEAENAACSSAISEMMGFARTFQDGEPACTKTVTVRLNGVAIKLKQNRQILVNGEDVTKLPMYAGGARLRIVSSIFVAVDLPNGLGVLWDGVSRVYVNAPPQFRGQTRGLCGTFTSGQKDDFLTPDGDVEQAVVPFANKWKTSEQCADVRKDTDHPCDLNPQKRAAAEKYCGVMKKKLFVGCHWFVDPEPFYKDCVFDMCACESNIETCLCPTLAAYAKDCAHLGVIVPWRQEVQECRVHCPGDQEYQVCGSSCTRSCADISFHHECKEECVEGCNCPKGYTLDVNGECIPIGQCPCTYGELEFLAGYREVRPGTKGQKLCTCAGGIWNCRLATADEIRDYPAVTQLKSLCSATRHQEVTTCEPTKPRTCRNMHQRRPQHTPAICRPGCICKTGYVLDSTSGECVREEDCPCYHGGKSYKEGSVMQEECNTCTCSAGKWNCTDIVCAGVCSVWGDSHYKTFDDRHYDFQGVCDYVLAKGKLSDEECFDVTIRNVACGTTGVTCSKSITLTVGKTNSAKQESITLTRGKVLTADDFRDLSRITARRAGLFVFLDVPDLGLVVQWDEGTRAYVRVDAKWKGRTKGLCGDYNDNARDDFKTPSGGMSEASANLFADSWKMSELCAEPNERPPDTCAQHPERKLWAVQKCRVMKSETFEPCHSEVEPEEFIDRCIYDTCGCDDGGDCECLCTAIAAYAHACNARGVPIKWRTQKMCPMQCDETCSNYSPCVSTCPRETCDNLATRDESLHLCDQDTCVEGCQPKDCPEGYIYLNSSYSKCVLRADCKTLCTVIDGVKYYEGDRVGGDDCHSCHCSRGKVVCTGSPCTTTMLMPSTTIRPPTVGTVPPSVVTVPPKDEPKECISGWTKWFNRDKPKSTGFRSDIEQLPSIIEMLEYEGSPVCEQDMIADIKCRTVDTKMSYKDTGLNVECSVDNGFACIVDPEMKQTCPDFEISVLCRCDNTPIATQPPGTPGVPLSTSTPPSEGIYDECNLSEPYRVDEKNCHEFLQCAPSLQGNIWIRKSCDPQLMFNEKTQICDWPPMVTLDRPECIDAPVTPSGPPGLLCPSGQRWDDCAIKCSRTCSYYKSQLIKYGHCNTPTNDQNCIPGCVPETRMDCSNTNYYWRDEVTCVERTDCMCVAEDGTAVAPGLLVHVSKCRSCQCLNNVMVCDDSACSTDSVTIEPPLNKTTDSGTQTIVSTSTPPPDCAEDNLVYLIEQSPFDVTYNASSYETVFITPDTIRLHTSNNMVWRPAPNDSNPWIEIRFDRPEAVYGVVVAGDAVDDSFVTSYKVKFSEDGRYFSDLIDEGKEPVLRGPADAKTPVRQMFRLPVEAKAVRLYPITKHKNIAMQVELIGCGEGQRVVTSTTTPKPPVITEKPPTPVCKDKMGYDNGQMSDQQVTTSSPSVYGSELNVHLSSPSVWRPHLDHQDQYVQFDFLEPRNLTGVKTKGGKGIWTTMYKVYYSNDGKVWNPVTDENRVAKQFLGNVDDHTSKVNYFIRPISARYLRVSPTKWHKHIGLKVEVIGCFVPYPPVTIPPTAPPLPLPSNCNICFGYPIESLDECKCKGSKWWDGQSCVKKADCPCYVGHVAYKVGTTYNTNDCQSCQCTLGGGSMCSPMKCPACSKSNERPVLTELCACLCKPCPVGERLCPTSGVCVAESKWCDHVEDCPDDEIGCDYDISVKNTTTTTTTVNKTIAVQCEIDCPPGYIKQYENESYGVKATMKLVFTETITTSFKKEVFFKAKIPPPAKKGMFESRFGESDVDKMCPQFVCIKKVEEGEKCPKVECPENFRLVVDQSKGNRNKDCNNICVPIPPKERVCKVLGRIFTTFDDTQYKYDICNHILARERYNNKWYIVAEKVCKDRSVSCLTTIQIHFDNHVVVLHPSMNVLFDGNVYTEREVKRLFENTLMKLSRVGNALRFESRLYPFWVMLEKNGDVKIGVSMIVDGDIDGMCGLMDGNKDNDKTKDDGKIAKNTQEFGDSWKLKDSAECKLMKCPEETSDEAWKMCSLIKDATFAACDKVLNRETFFQSCIDSSCACLSSGNMTSRDCRCRALSSFVAECLARDRNVDLSGWRSAHECPAVCDAPFVHKDCFRNKCEMTCKNLQQADPCPMMDGLCVPGCFCPDGMVRNGDTCVPPSECRDCVCSGLGNSKYVTFDKDNLLFNGNCTYVLSRDIVNTPNGESAYQVLVSNGLCGRDICVEAITVLYESHVVQIRRDNQTHELMSVVNGKVVSQLPYSSSWLHLEETPSREIKLLIPSIQLEVVNFKHDFTFMLRLPSHTFGGLMEGLCGDCDGNYNNDFKMFGGQLTKDAQEFGNSWLITDIPASLQLSTEHCFSSPSKRCADDPSIDGVCGRLLRDEAFTRCHALVDPTPYYLACKDTLCQWAYNSICSNFEAYARMCSVSGICIDWRTGDLCPYSCPNRLGYEACYSGCPDTCEALNNPAFRCLFETPIEGCFCPPGYAWHNNSCVPRRNCFICDDEGHVEGDVWYPNKCTQCTCQSKRVKCQETSCPTKQPVCEVNATPVVVPGTQDDCCPQYLCVPNTNTDCVESQQPKCGFGQTLKVSVDANGCQKFICECVPEDQCATLSNEIESEAELLMEPGYVQVIDKSGCCPKTARICKPETCPPPQMCQPYHVPVEKTVPNSCCPTFVCEPPKDVCLYYVDSGNELVTEDKLLAKKVGEMWTDGNCKTCVCELKDDVPTARCTMRECLSVTDHPDLADFVLKETQAADQCCPNFERKACKFDGRTYKVNAKWRPNDEDACEEIECARDANGLLIKRTVRQECLQACELGYEYRPSANKAKSCCGDCIPVACVVNGALKYAGESWQSEDYCTTSTCVLANGSLHVEMTSESCETIDPSEESNYKIKTQKVDGKCCPQIVRTACLSDGKYYKPGKSWKSSVDSCIFESCVETAEGLIVKQKETKTCNTNCPQGWEYQAPVEGTCCGECQQIYCILDDVLYEPGKVWYSADNCTTYSCTQKNDQLLISTSSPVCPELNCAKDLIYNDGCCNKCKAVPPSQVEPICVAKAIDLKKTVGIIVEENPTHGICKNLKTIKQLTKCDGHCDSSTSFDFTTWSEIIDCKCCKPASYRSLTVILTCDDGEKIVKTLSVPKSCSCNECTPEAGPEPNKEQLFGNDPDVKSFFNDEKTEKIVKT